MLSMPSKMILMEYVLRTMPTFYLMLLDFTDAGYKELEAVYRQFMWGTQSGGQAKVPLVAWSRICQPYAEGGLGMLDFKTQAQVFKLQFFAGILGMHNADWVHLACAEMRASLKKGVLKKETKFWMVSEYLLLQPPVKFTSKIIQCLLKSWSAVWPRLKLVLTDGEITWNLSLFHVYCMFRKGGEFLFPEFRRLRVWAQSRRVYIVDDLYGDAGWLQEEDFASRIRSSRHIDRPIFLEFFEYVTSFSGVTSVPIAWMEGWEWSGFPRVTTGWTLPNRIGGTRRCRQVWISHTSTADGGVYGQGRTRQNSGQIFVKESPIPGLSLCFGE
jgi:hypothetical protein